MRDSVSRQDQGHGVEIGGNNIRAAIDLLPDVLRRFKAKAVA